MLTKPLIQRRQHQGAGASNVCGGSLEAWQREDDGVRYTVGVEMQHLSGVGVERLVPARSSHAQAARFSRGD
jgi:hypothetical protein